MLFYFISNIWGHTVCFIYIFSVVLISKCFTEKLYIVSSDAQYKKRYFAVTVTQGIRFVLFFFPLSKDLYTYCILSCWQPVLPPVVGVCSDNCCWCGRNRCLALPVVHTEGERGGSRKDAEWRLCCATNARQKGKGFGGNLILGDINWYTALVRSICSLIYCEKNPVVTLKFCPVSYGISWADLCWVARLTLA